LSECNSPRSLDHDNAGGILRYIGLIPYESSELYNISSVTVTSRHCNIQEDLGLCQHCYENLKSYAAQDRLIWWHCILW